MSSRRRAAERPKTDAAPQRALTLLAGAQPGMGVGMTLMNHPTGGFLSGNSLPVHSDIPY